jgi:Flp pilus assembly protein TadG
MIVRRVSAPAPYAGQTLVIFALCSLVLLGILGLAIDGGYNFGQRRAMQAAADAAALAGARVVLIDDNHVQSVYNAVKTIAMQNGLPDPDNAATGATLECRYIKNDYATTQATYGPCKDNVPGGGVSGVVVTVGERHDTFAMRVLGIAKSGTGATAAAQIQSPATFTPGPFLPCGIDTDTTTGTYSIFATTGSNYSGTSYPIAQEPVAIRDGAYYYDWSAGGLLTPINYGTVSNPDYGPVFVIHGPHVATCNITSSSFKGQGFTNGQITLTHGGYSGPGETIINGDTGTQAGVTASVAGANGCTPSQTDRCVMILPIIDNSSSPCCQTDNSGSSAKVAVRMWGAFYVTQEASNKHHGRLIRSYSVIGEGSSTWDRAHDSVVVIRLIR